MEVSTELDPRFSVDRTDGDVFVHGESEGEPNTKFGVVRRGIHPINIEPDLEAEPEETAGHEHHLAWMRRTGRLDPLDTRVDPASKMGRVG